MRRAVAFVLLLAVGAPSSFAENRVETRSALGSDWGLIGSAEVDMGKNSRLSLTLDGDLGRDGGTFGGGESIGFRWRLGTHERPWGAGAYFGVGAGLHADEQVLAAIGATQVGVEAWHHWIKSKNLRLVSKLNHTVAKGTVAGVGPNGLIGTSVALPSFTTASLSVRVGKPAGVFGSLGLDIPVGSRDDSSMTFGVGTAF